MKSRVIFVAILVSILVWFTAYANAANPYLVKDINAQTAVASSNPTGMVVCNGVLYFAATTLAEGTELWKSDGTVAGTVLVKDIYPGMDSSSPSNFAVVGSTVYFTANNGVSGVELWKTDGTAAGTVMVKDINVDPGANSYPQNLTPVGTYLYFTADDGNSGPELWRTDGTAAGTFMIMDINPGTTGSGPASLRAVGTNDLLFRANDGVNGYELWRHIVSSNQTFLVKNINNSAGTGSYPNYFTDLNYILYFSASDGISGTELWQSNGLPSGTTRITDINSGTGSSSPYLLTVMGSSVFFRAYDPTNFYALWKYDTPTSTLSMIMGTANSSPSNLTVMGGYLYFSAYDATYGQELWKTTTTGATAVSRISDINSLAGNSSPANLTVMGSYLYFTASDGSNYAIYRTNGGTPTKITGSDSPIANLTPSNLVVMANANGTNLYYSGYDATHGRELWKVDGSTATASLVKDINSSNGTASSNFLSTGFEVMGNYLYFTAFDGTNYALWKTDGTSVNTSMISGTASTSQLYYPTAMGGYLYFSAYDATYGQELWKTTNTGATAASRISDINLAGSSSPANLTVMGSYLYFTALFDGTNYGIYKTAGSTPTPVNGTVHSYQPANLTALSNSYGTYLYYTVNDATYGVELWKTDGTNPSIRFTDINSLAGSSSPASLTVMDSYLYFTAFDGTNYDIWRTDGATLARVAGTTASQLPSSLAVMNGYLYFSGYSVSTGMELWKTDGTTTSLVKDIYPGIGFSNPWNLTVIGSTLYFTAYDGTHGTELWRSDGSSAGTSMVQDIWPGTGSGMPRSLTAVGSTLYFVATSPDTGYELWKSDGTATGTIPVGDMRPGPLGDSNINYLTLLNGKILFQALDPVYGLELFAYDTTYPTGTIDVPSSAGYVTSTAITLNLTCSDPGGSCTQMRFSTDNLNWSAAEAFSTAKSWTIPSGDGPKLIYVMFQDNSGNWSNPYLIRVVLDTTAPSTYLTAYPSVTTTSSATTFMFTSNKTTNFECLLDDDPAGFQSCTSPKKYTLYAGTHLFQVRAVDPAGRADPNPVQYSWTIYDTLDGVAAGWGANIYGTIGNGTTDSNPHPAREKVPSPINFIQLAAGVSHSIGLRNDGTVWVWGQTVYKSSNVPTQITGLSDVVAVAAGYDFSLALKSDGTVWHWGYYYYPANPQYISAPTQVTGIGNVSAIAAGPTHALAISNGYVYGWGYNKNGELGPNVALDSYQATPIYLLNFYNLTAVSAGVNTSYALKSDGTVWAWGYGGTGQLGNGVDNNSATPVQVTATGMTNIKSLATGGTGYHMLAIDASGNTWGWGHNTYGQLGLGAGQYAKNFNVPQKGTALSNVTAMAVGGNFTLFLTKGNSVWSAGYNANGELGQGLYDSSWDHSVPEMVGYLNGAFQVAAGYNHALALSSKWISYNLDITYSSRSSIVLDTDENPHTAYIATSSVRYKSSTGRKWNPYQVIDNSLIYLNSVSLVLDAANNAHVCYQGRNNSTGKYELRYSTNKGGTWLTTPTVLDADATYVYDAGNCHIAYNKSPDGYESLYVSFYSGTLSPSTLKLKKKVSTAIDSGIWQTYNIDTSNYSVGMYHSLAVDTYNTVMVAYTDDSYSPNTAIIYAKGNDSIWTKTAIDASSTERYPSIALIPGTQNPAIAYSEAYSCAPLYCFRLKYAESDGLNWTVYTVDDYDQRSVGDSQSLAFSKSGIPQISYHDQTGDDLRIATGTTDRTVWRLTAVDTDGSTGKNSSIAVDSLNAAHISYNGNNSSFKYATNLDADPPSGTVLITPTATYNSINYVKSTSVALVLTCDDGIGVDSTSTGGKCWQMKLSNNNVFNASLPETFVASKQWTLNSTNGTQTVYAKFRDSANNWSDVVHADIFLDTVPPTGSLGVVSSNGFTNNRLVLLTTTCNEVVSATTSGCSTMKFSTDGVTYSTALPYATESSIFLPATDGQKDVYAIYTDKAGNDSLPIHATVKLDSTAPTTSADFPGASYSTAQTVTLSCSDGIGIGCAGTWYSLDGSPPTLPYSVPLVINKNLTLKYYSVDKLGNIEAVVSQTYSFVPGYTKLSLELSTPTIAFGGSLTAFGRLQNMTNPSNNADPTGEKITLTITDPDGIATTQDTLIVNKQGQYIQTLSGFAKKGAYLISAHFIVPVPSLLSPSDSTSLPLMVGASAGYAILVEGKLSGPTPEGIASHNKTANRIYQKLKARGFDDNNIYYFNYDTTQTGVDAAPSKAEIQFAVQTWAKNHMNGLPAPLYIIMVDHGGQNAFYIDSETIIPSDLANWLATLEAGLNAQALLEKRAVIIGSCFSGSFISALSQKPVTGNAGRVIITSAAPTEVSYKGPLESDNIRSGEYFLEELFTQLERGQTIRQSFIEATALTRIYTQQGGSSTNSIAPYFDGAVQHPMIDDNGDGLGSNSLSSDATQDGATVAAMVLGAGIAHNTNSALNPAEILKVTDTVILATNQYSALLWATVNDVTQVDSTVWVEIRSPLLVLDPTATGSIQVDLNTFKIPMTLNTAGTRYEVTVTNLIENGRYDIFYFVRDKATLKLAPMKRSSVYHAIVGNPAPTTPDMTNAKPLSGSHQSTSLYFSWGKVVDAHPPVSYSLFISTDMNPDYSNAAYVLENIGVNHAAIGPEAGLLINTPYYWKVRAIDRYGAYSDSSPIMNFDTPSLNNADVVILTGTVLDSSNSLPVRASIGVSAQTTVADVDGTYFFPNLGTVGNFTITTSATGYTPDVKQIAIASQGRLTTFTHDVALVPAATDHHTVNVTAVGINGGSGSVSSSPSQDLHVAISCPTGSNANCSVPFPSAQTNVDLTYTKSAGTIFGGWTGDCTGSALACTLADMTATRNVTATFTKTPPFKRSANGGAYAYDIQSAYDAAGVSDTIQMQEIIPAGVFTAYTAAPATAKVITLDGGYDADFTPGPSGTFTTIQGKLTVKNGTLKVQRVKVK